MRFTYDGSVVNDSTVKLLKPKENIVANEKSNKQLDNSPNSTHNVSKTVGVLHIDGCLGYGEKGQNDYFTVAHLEVPLYMFIEKHKIYIADEQVYRSVE